MPYFNFDYVLNANDSYSQIKAARYILDNGLFEFWQYYDITSWYPYGREWGSSQYIMTPLSAVVTYLTSNFIGFTISLDEAAFIAPGIFGSLSVLVIYFLGKEIANKKVGLLSAFFLSVSPGHIQRSMAGFFDNEAVGVFLLLLFIYFFLRSLRTGSFFSTALSGIMLGLLMDGWGGSSYALQLVSLYVFVMIILKRYSRRLFLAYSGTASIALFIAMIVPRNGPARVFFDIDGLMVFGMIGVMMLIDLYQNNKEFFNGFVTSKNIEKLGYGVVITGVLVFLLNLFFPIIPLIQAKFVTVLLPFLREGTPILKSVAEHLIVTWGSLFRNLFLIFFLLPIGLVYTYQKPTEKNIFLLVFALTALYFAGSMVRLILILAPAAALIAAKAIDETLIPYALVFQEKFFLSKRKKMVSASIGNEHVAAAFIVIFFVLVFQFFQGVSASQGVVSSPSSITLPLADGSNLGDWHETMDWIIRNTDKETAVIASWWDYGYWINVNTNRTIVVDNATTNHTQIGNIGAFMMSTPDISLQIAKYYDITHYVVLVAGGLAARGADNDLGKTQWMVKIAEQNSNLAPKFNAPIVTTDFFEIDSQGREFAFAPDFYNSLIWGTMTEGLDPQVYGQFAQYPLVSNTLTGVHQGFGEEWEIYKQIFIPAYQTSNTWIRVWEIDWDAAARLVGV
jgi:dolichyl-diphosphooligosaccharide--protein glycosyltransferase